MFGSRVLLAFDGAKPTLWKCSYFATDELVQHNLGCPIWWWIVYNLPIIHVSIETFHVWFTCLSCGLMVSGQHCGNVISFSIWLPSNFTNLMLTENPYFLTYSMCVLCHLHMRIWLPAFVCVLLFPIWAEKKYRCTQSVVKWIFFALHWRMKSMPFNAISKSVNLNCWAQLPGLRRKYCQRQIYLKFVCPQWKKSSHCSRRQSAPDAQRRLVLAYPPDGILQSGFSLRSSVFIPTGYDHGWFLKKQAI